MGLASPPRAALDVVTTLATAGSSHTKSGEAAVARARARAAPHMWPLPPWGWQASTAEANRHRSGQTASFPAAQPQTHQGANSTAADAAQPPRALVVDGWSGRSARVGEGAAAVGGEAARTERSRSRQAAARSAPMRRPKPACSTTHRPLDPNNSGRRESDRAAQPALATLGGTAAAAAAAAALSRSSSTFSPSTARASSHRASSHRASSHRALSACSSSRAPPGTSRRASKVP